MVASLGGPADLVANPDRHLEQTPFIRPVFAQTNGYVAQVDARAVGLTLVGIGSGGRGRTSRSTTPSDSLA
jgi:thymidine phosphorylase